ncbi:MAG: hypothetical protein H0V27_02815 [Pyrinomonadaceae bacterium]|nr:hypothetical protein [Pyrinomonadaceae bacterium]
MLLALLLALFVVISGALLTYLFDPEAKLESRLSAGACIGFALFGLVGFGFASLAGSLTPLTILLTIAVLAAPFSLLSKESLRAHARFDWNDAVVRLRTTASLRDHRVTISTILSLFILLLLWLVFRQACFERAGEIYTGVDNNLGDLPFHLGTISGFVRGENYPPEHTEYAGARLTYPFLIDFVAALFTRAGASLRGSLLLENTVLAFALFGVLKRWAEKLTGDFRAALIAVCLVFLSGGLGWWMFLSYASEHGFFETLMNLPRNYTMTGSLYRWGNSLTVLFVPQRSLLLGLPLFLVVATLWWEVSGGEGEEVKRQKEKGKKSAKRARRGKMNSDDVATVIAPSISPDKLDERRMIAAGAVAGLLPLAHAHGFAVLMMIGACLALLFRRWRLWFIFFAVASLLALPQMWWVTRGSAMQAESFFGLQYGWDRGDINALRFWFVNLGMFIPLLVAALLWRTKDDTPLVSRRLLFYYLPFTLCFIIPNTVKLAPWIWDNIKVIFFWYVASAPLVALMLVHLWQGRGIRRAAACVLFFTLVFAGALDVWRVVRGSGEQKIFTSGGIAFGRMMEDTTHPRSRVLHAPIYNHPALLSGRRSLMGYPGHLWTHGIDYRAREADIKRMYAGGADANALLAKYNVDYVVVSPLERAMLTVNENFFMQHEKIGEVGAYRLYKIARP